MKKLMAIVLLWVGVAYGQNSKKIDSKITKVVVFRAGAQVTRMANVAVVAGANELVFRNISPKIDQESIQVGGEGNLTILSVNFRTDYTNDATKTIDYDKWSAQKELLNEKIRIEEGYQQIYKQEEGMILRNQTVGNSTVGTKASDVKEMADFQRLRLAELLNKQVEVERNIKKLKEELRKTNQQLTYQQTENTREVGEMVVRVSAKEPANGKLTLTYFVQNAGWNPVYDIRAKDTQSPLLITYRADAFQYSGEDWKDVLLTLSTANPKQRGDKPTLKTWYWGRPNSYADYFGQQNAYANTKITEVTGFVKSANDNNPLPGVSVVIKRTNRGVNTDINGFYRIAIPPDAPAASRQLVFSYVGFQTHEQWLTTAKMDMALYEDMKQLQEVMAVGFSDKAEEGWGANKSLAAKVAGARARGMNSAPALEVEEKDAPTSVTYNVAQAYSLPSDGVVYGVEIKTAEAAAYFEHYTAPKITPDVFLSAYIPNWESLSLLEGEANLYLEDTFVGKSSLRFDNVGDSLQISLGRDKNIIANRTKTKDFSQKKILSDTKISQYGYEISVRNTKKIPINLVVEDQFPITSQKNIEIYDREATDATVESETGIIRWQFKLNAAQDRKLRLRYTVKYPKYSGE